MRDIKFRAWCDHTSTMIEFSLDEAMGWIPVEGVYSDAWIIMQFTGLKDKNGKEIYEGDIVETIYCSSNPHKGEIYFQPTRLNWSVKHSGFTNQDLFVYSRPDCSVEIIGNIYESPELLTNHD